MAFALTVAERPQTASAHGYRYAVGMYDDYFWPASISVPVGGTVTWVNYGHHRHTTTSVRSRWDSGVMHRGDTFSVRFLRSGSFYYYCRIHPDTMRGVVHVGNVPYRDADDFRVTVSVTVFSHGAPRYGFDRIHPDATPGYGY
jgi:plastocyanin